jgi:serine/threonine-protein kinase
MAFRTRVWGAGKLVMLGSALVGTYLLFAAASMRIALRTREVEVPDLVGRSANEASALASNLGLAIRVDDLRRADAKVPAGRVLAQEPPAGAPSRIQRTVRVWLSAGPHAASMPTVTGETERAASLRIAQDGLEIATISEIRSHAYPTDVVVAQDPPARAESARVALLVNRSQPGISYVMPDLIGVNGDRSIDILRGQGFRVAVVGATPYPGVAAGIVIRQNPQAGFQIAPGEPISIEVSR